MNEGEDTAERFARKLGYTQRWFDLGVVDAEAVRRQMAEWADSGDHFEEHYRHRAFGDYLRRRDGLTDEELLQILRLDDDGRDATDLRESRVIMLLDSGLLSDDQIEGLVGHPSLSSKSVQMLHQRHRVLRRLGSEGLSTGVFEAIQLSEDATLQRTALEHDGLTLEQASWLASNGVNRRVRNVAGQRAKRLMCHKS